jgi:transcriptional regulator with XRE-family HTH domain
MTAADADARDLPAPEIAEQVGLALRAVRRSGGWSQRRLAAELGVPQSAVGRMECHADVVSLGGVAAFLAQVGLALAVVDADGVVIDQWEETDLLARDRRGRRFPAHRTVRRSAYGPRWWEYHEYFGARPEGERPEWTAEGFAPPEGTRYGKPPRPTREGEGPRWPF